MILQKELVNKYIGIRYKDNGRSIKYGLDCWGLIMCCIKDMYNIVLPDTTYNIRSVVRNKQSIFNNYNIYDWVTKNDTPDYGNIILLNAIKDVAIHTGIYINTNKMLHASLQARGVILEDLTKYKNTIVGFYQINKEKLND
jgi:cell wall-associated NlpC family hydrolase